VKNIIFTFVLYFSISLASAQEIVELSKKVKCSELVNVLDYFATTFKENPIWAAKTSNNTYVTLLANNDTKSWTLIEYSSVVACVLAVGLGKDSVGI
jgi:hypothetical protein